LSTSPDRLTQSCRDVFFSNDLRCSFSAIRARGEQPHKHFQIQDEAHGWFSFAEVGREIVVSAATPHTRSGALDINLEGESGVIVDPRYISEVDLETIGK